VSPDTRFSPSERTESATPRLIAQSGVTYRRSRARRLGIELTALNVHNAPTSNRGASRGCQAVADRHLEEAPVTGRSDGEGR
jgi:hypothetical protein